MVNGAVEMIGTGGVEGADLYAPVVTELHVVDPRRSTFACRCWDSVFPGAVGNEMKCSIIVNDRKHASLGKGNRGLDKAGTLCMDCVGAGTGGPLSPTADDQHANQA